MARVLMVVTVLAASLPVGSPLIFSSFASNCSDIGANGTIAEREALKEIRVLGFIPCSQPKGNVSGCPNRPPQLEGSDFEVCCWVDDIPILAMSLDQINSDPTLLPGYRLVLDAVKSEVRLHRRSQDSGRGGSIPKGAHRLGKNFGSWISQLIMTVNDIHYDITNSSEVL